MAASLTTLCPLRSDLPHQPSTAALLREQLAKLPRDEASPFARVPSLFMCRMFVLDDVCLQGHVGHGGTDDRLRSKYLVFAADLSIGAKQTLDVFFDELWANAQAAVWDIWQHCLGFEHVTNAAEFAHYLKQCQMRSALSFAGNADTSLAEQLKALYVKQEFALFAREYQGQDAITLQRAFRDFVRRVQPFELTQPSWRRGASQLDTALATEPLS
jgi:hypothetical protein